MTVLYPNLCYNDGRYNEVEVYLFYEKRSFHRLFFFFLVLAFIFFFYSTLSNKVSTFIMQIMIDI